MSDVDACKSLPRDNELQMQVMQQQFISNGSEIFLDIKDYLKMRKECNFLFLLATEEKGLWTEIMNVNTPILTQML